VCFRWDSGPVTGCPWLPDVAYGRVSCCTSVRYRRVGLGGPGFFSQTRHTGRITCRAQRRRRAVAKRQARSGRAASGASRLDGEEKVLIVRQQGWVPIQPEVSKSFAQSSHDRPGWRDGNQGGDR
jgi:hypothetical protein